MRKSTRSRWRAGVLIAVNVAMIAHFVQWRISGSTISPVEPSETQEFLREGTINAGLIFFCLAILATAVFGRFFCGWGCHIVALQDLCAWMMKKVGVRPRMFRSRLLMWAPMILALYMFVWPVFLREALEPLLANQWPAALAFVGSAPPFAGVKTHLIVDDFWATFPTVAVAVPFFLVVGFGAVYFLGSKGFCNYGCPYGAFFGVADRFAPGQIVADLNACEGCGHCTATCTSNVEVHKEIQIRGRVESPGCFKCMDCVSVCPNDALSFGYSRPRLFVPKPAAAARPKRQFDLTRGQEVLLGGVFLFAFLVSNGLYGVIPRLMAMGVAAIFTFLVWKLWRLLRARDLRFHRFQLKRNGRLRSSGAVLLGTTLLLCLLALQAGIVKGAIWRSDVLVRQIGAMPDFSDPAYKPANLAPADRERAEKALGSLRLASSLGEGGIGLRISPLAAAQRVTLLLLLGQRQEAADYLEHLIDTLGANDALCAERLRVMHLAGHGHAAAQECQTVLLEHPEFRELRGELFRWHEQNSRPVDAEPFYLAMLERRPDDAEARAFWAASVLMKTRRQEQAEQELLRAVQDAPEDVRVRLFLADCLWTRGKQQRAITELQEVVRLDPANVPAMLNLVEMLRQTGRDSEADEYARRAELARWGVTRDG